MLLISDFVASESDSHATRGLRDMMGLLALPTLWAGRDGRAVLQIMIEALERIVPIRFSYAEEVLLSHQPKFVQVRVEQTSLTSEEEEDWHRASEEWRNGPAANAFVALSATPLGEMRVARFKLSYGEMGGNIWFGSLDPDFPSVVQLSILRAATTLAAGGLQNARVDHERDMASRAKDEFLAMLGHELRNPLAPISAAAELLRRGKLDEGRIRKTSEVISRQVGHMTNLINDLLDVSRVNSGLVTLETSSFLLVDILSEAIEQVRPAIENKKHVFDFDSPTQAIHVSGDQKRLVQIFSNLIVNAVKYTPAGGHIRLEVALRVASVEITVTDDGIGISDDLLSNVFDLFTQAKRSPDRASGGLGLGLALVRKLVGLHNGSVTAHSDGMNAGSRFRVVLPIVPSPAESPEKLQEAGFKPTGRLRIMVVDDNVDAAQMLTMMLEMAGHEVCVEYSPESALSRTHAEHVDVYLLDLGLPGIDGNELARRLKKTFPSGRSLYIAITGYGQPYDRQQTAAAGFDHHFVKPVDPHALLALLEDMAE
jgi:signal transduction histidine kinase